ncbi:helix-turn-helix transcriptional regulator [Treponema sp. OMZ 840]|uniref:helix-turn-helix domain-containing protein n=1 Tax=Treponema sp. OMZ 840 TaxID=244313 RepID=UPI003D8C304E
MKKSEPAKKAPYRFGEKLRKVRERKGYTLKVVASQAGVSESLVSQIERNKVSPAIDTLLALADVLDVNIEFLFDEFRHKRPVKIIRSGERRTVEEDAVHYEELAKPSEKDGTHSIESYMITIPPGEHTKRGSYGHLGCEMGFIIEGKAGFKYESQVYTLEEGDSISFSAAAPHTLSNTGTGILKALWVVSPAQRFN